MYLRCGWQSCLTVLAFTPVLCQAQGYKTTTVAGIGARARHAAGTNISHNFSGPGVLAVDARGNIYISVRDGILSVDAAGNRTRVAGIEREWRYAGDGGLAIEARLNPRGIAFDAAGNLYLADSANNRVRRIDAGTGVIRTVAGSGVRGFSGDGGPATSAQLDGPTGVVVDALGNLYIADAIMDGHMRIREVAAGTSVITTVAGNGSQGYSGDGGAAISAQISSLGGLATDVAGNLYIADNYNNRIRMVSAQTGIISTVAGNGAAGHAGDGDLAVNAQLDNPLQVAVDTAGNLYIADSANFRIRKVTAAGRISTLAGKGSDASLVYSDNQSGYPCALAIDKAGNLYIADSGTSRIRRVPAGAAREIVSEADLAVTAIVTHANPAGLKINVTYDATVPAAAKTAFNNVIAVYEKLFSTNITVNVDVIFGNTSLGESDTFYQTFSYASWRTAMIANATGNPGNKYNVDAAATLPVSDPYLGGSLHGSGNVSLETPLARALGFSANTDVDSTLTFVSTPGTFEYTGVSDPNLYDFMDTAAHELDEVLAINSALTGLTNNGAIPNPTDFAAEDYFRYSVAPGKRDITLNPSAAVYFSYNGGVTDVAQFNQNNNGDDVNDWIYAETGCPATSPGPYIQDADGCPGEVEALGLPGSPEVIVLNSLGYNSATALDAQTITFNQPANVTFGAGPFSISATASSGLSVSFASTTVAVCTVSLSTVTLKSAGTCSITASQPGNTTYAAAVSVARSFTVNPAAQTITFATLTMRTLGSGSFALSATATSGLTVTFASNSPTICTVSGVEVTLVAKGTCSITASQSGGTDYLTATPVTRTFIVSVGPPAIVSLSPNEGIGTTVTFKAVYSDPSGAADLSELLLQVNTSQSSANACYVYYQPQGNHLYLASNAGAWITPALTPGVTGTASNSQCTLNAASSSVTKVGNDLTLNVALSFSSTFVGLRNVYLYAAGLSGETSGWVAAGTWIPKSAGPPAIVSLSPDSGTGKTVTLKAVYSDPNGAADLSEVLLQINNTQSSANGCYVYYQPQGNHLYLADNSGAFSTTALVPGVAGTASNTQCTLNAGASSVTKAGDDLTLNIALTFSSTFTGAKNSYLYAAGLSGQHIGWVRAGSWTPTPAPGNVTNVAGSIEGLYPGSGAVSFSALLVAGTFTVSFDILPGAQPFQVLAKSSTAPEINATININPAQNTWQAVYTVPSSAVRATGQNWSFSGDGFTVLDFTTCHLVGGVVTCNPFPGNIVPYSRQDPIASAALALLPEPNTSSANSPNSTYVSSGALPAGGHFAITSSSPGFGGFIDIPPNYPAAMSDVGFQLFVDDVLVASKQISFTVD